MQLGELYRFVIEYGQRQDPRRKEDIGISLEQAKMDFEKTKTAEKEYFDKEKLSNPYADTRILLGDADTQIKTVFVGIDIEIGELLVVDRLREKGEKIDLALAHHPEGKAYANFYEVMHMQADILNRYGVPINVAEGLLEKRIKEVEKKVMPVNHTRAVDAAKLLNIPFMCVHTPADNCVASYLQSLFDKNKPVTLESTLEIIRQIPEYQQAAKDNNAPRIIIGKSNSRTGKIFVDMTGGTEGAPEIFEKLAQVGIGTIVAMHFSDKHFEQAEKAHINVVIAGHIASDTLGLNLLLDAAIKKFGAIKIIPCSGFNRYAHIQKVTRNT